MRAEWTNFYEELANKLKTWSPGQLYQTILSLAKRETFLGYMHFENEELWQERGHKLDPFTVIGIFNRGQTDEHRHHIATILAKIFNLDQKPPTCYHGIPHLDPRKSIYDGDSEMWALFNASLAGPQESGFSAAYTTAKNVKGNGLGTLSIGLFWIRPYQFMALDRISSPYIEQICGIASPEEKCSGQEYADFMAELAKALKPKDLTYPEVAFAAWQEDHDGQTCPEN